jgi:hypothetical protein
MKVRRVICRDCGHEDKVEIFTREEADRKHMQLVPSHARSAAVVMSSFRTERI